jgi:energy-coupling factor transport system substrate-specific component
MSWQLSSIALLALVLLGGFLWYERKKPPARVLALVAALAALAVVGRLAFAAVPNVKPTTDIVLFAGYALGAVPGFVVGAVTALVSNLFLSHGPWTAWQMAGWGGVGAGAALLARALRGRELGRLPLAIVCGAAGLAFGAWMDVYQWTLAARQDLDSYLAVSASSLPYNLAHAIGNVAFCLLIGPAFVQALRRYRRRLEVRWELSPAAVAGAAIVALTIGAAWAGGDRAAATPSAAERAARYLERSQNRDGGFGGARGQASNHLHTGWSALGLASARRNPRDVRRRGGRAITTFVSRNARSLRDIGEVERTILVLRAAGLSPRTFAGRDLVAVVRGRRRGDGSIAGYVSYTAFGVLALRAAGQPAGSGSITYLRRSQNGDGGFGVAASSASDTDMTAAVMQALAAVGRLGGSLESRAVAYLRSNQNSDGGFSSLPGRGSNAQSTAYAVQGLIAARVGSGMVRRALAYLRGLQRRDGSIRYSRTSAQTPVWVTAQALMALRRRPLPIPAVPLRGRAAGRTARSARAGAEGRTRNAGNGEGGPAEVLAEGTARGMSPGRLHALRVRNPTAAAAPAGGEPAAGPSALLVAAALSATLAVIVALRRRLHR